MDGDAAVTSMLLSRLHYPVRNLGYGVRAGIWFQGCTVYCQGCISRDTWPFDEAHRSEIASVLDWIDRIDGPIDGITISGGEPTDQPDALRALLDGLSPLRGETDIALYSGRSSEHLQRDLPWLWDSVDLLISDPYEAAGASACALRGSENQRVHRLSPLAEQRYPTETFDEVYGSQRQQVSIHVDDHSVWMVGIPQPGDLERMKHALSKRGITVRRTSWLT